MTSSAGRCYPDTGEIRIATLYHRDHGIDATLLVLKHELAHWAARWRYGRRIAPHGREFRKVAHELDPRITITCPPFAQKERSAAPGLAHDVPALPPHVHAAAAATRSPAAGAATTTPAGRYDRRFRLVVVSRAE